METPGTYEVTKPDIVTDIVEYADGRLGLAIEPTWDEAVVQTEVLVKMGKNIAWWMGDWLNYMESVFGEEWAQLIPDVGREEGTLMNYKWVARAVHPDVREKRLPFSIHAIVARLTPDLQAMWLERAMEGGWSCAQLTKEMKGEPKEREPKFQKVKISCPECECVFEVEV